MKSDDPTTHDAPLTTHQPRNRIKSHRRVLAGDLIPHELNFRVHTESQRAALDALYRDIGFARSLLAYELPDGKLKLIDGHLRRDMDPDMEVDVEILDVNDEEARALLLSIDPPGRVGAVAGPDPSPPDGADSDGLVGPAVSLATDSLDHRLGSAGKTRQETSTANRIGLQVSRNRDLPRRDAPAGAARAV